MEQLLRVFTPALCAAMSIPLIHIPIMRFRKHVNEAFAWMAVSFAASVGVWYLLSKRVLLPQDQPQLILASLSLLLFLWLGYLELMFKLYRGFSYTLLTDIRRLQPVTTDRLSSEFAEGTGMDDMLHRRITTLTGGGFLVQEQDSLVLTPKGRRSASITIRFKSFLKLGCGG